MFGWIFWICLLVSCHLKSRTFLQDGSLIPLECLGKDIDLHIIFENSMSSVDSIIYQVSAMPSMNWFSCGRLFPLQNIFCFSSYIIKKEVSPNMAIECILFYILLCIPLTRGGINFSTFFNLVGCVNPLTNKIQWKWYSQSILDLNWPGSFHFLFGIVF